MKTKILIAAVVSAILLISWLPVGAATTIDPDQRLAYGANVGWMDWRSDTNHGVVVGEYVCSGGIYCANVGWIDLGNGAPTNGVYYQNLSPDDFGVNQDGLGNLRGYAWGANIGWVAFETNGAPRVDMATGKMSGYAWSANCGWISLSNAVAWVQTDAIAPGTDSDHNGLPDAWEILHFGRIGVDPNADPDGDGMSNLEEYLAGTDPNDAADNLRITYMSRGDVLPGFTTLRWTSVATRFYTVQYRLSLDQGAWSDVAGFGFGADTATFSTGTNNPVELYRIRAYRPLGP